MSNEKKAPGSKTTGGFPPDVVAWMALRGRAFGKATASKKGRPIDGVTYGAGTKKPKAPRK